MLRVAAAALVLSLAAAPALAADGAQLFNMQCRMCHQGTPMGPALISSAKAPRNQVMAIMPEEVFSKQGERSF